MQPLEHYQRELNGLDAAAILAWAFREFGKDQIALASSLGAEDQVLTHMMSALEPAVRVFTLDTGRFPQATYDVMQASMDRYGLQYEVYCPDAEDLAELMAGKGPNLFYRSREDRKACCEVRKLRPLRRALATVKAWICGLRQEQSVTRRDIGAIEWDAENGIYKVNPLYRWTAADVWNFIRGQHVPYNALHDAGYPSIGCAPCTRATAKGEDIRAGRWWWEEPEHKECGLHNRRRHP